MAPGSKPKPAFFLAVLVVVAGLVGLSFYRWNSKKTDAGHSPGSGSEKIDMGSIKQQAGGSGAGSGQAQAENPDPNSITTVKEYSFEPQSRLPELPANATADYTALGKPRVVKFAVNVWAGWAPIIWANQGAKAKKVWKDAKRSEEHTSELQSLV